MAALFGFFGRSNDSKPAAKPYSIEHLHRLYEKLTALHDSEEPGRESMVEVIRQITEALIWGEQNDHDRTFFDFFCEKKILAYFVKLLQPAGDLPKTVQVQLLQTLSMLVQNIRRETSLYYLFSNNYVNQLVSTQLEWSDEEILGYYISFLKSLALRLNNETIKFFFLNDRHGQFPLYVEGVRFFAHHDNMVRTAVRTLTLQVYSIEDKAMRKFVLEQSSQTYFIHIACHLRELWYQLDAAAQVASTGLDHAVDRLKDLNEQLQDLLMYLSDVLEREVPDLGEALAERLLLYAIFPVAVRAILSRPAPDDLDTEDSSLDVKQNHESPSSPAAIHSGPSALSLQCALFVLHQVLDSFRMGHGGELLLRPLLMALLRPSVPTALLRCCRQSPWPPPSTYKASNPDVSGPASVEMNAVSSSWASSPRSPSSPSRRNSEEALTEPDDDPRAVVGLLDMSRPGAVVENHVRRRLLDCLQDENDACSLLAAGVLSACFRHCGTIPQDAEELPARDQSNRVGQQDVHGAPSTAQEGTQCSCQSLEAFEGTWRYGENSRSQYRIRRTQDNVFHLTERLLSGTCLYGVLQAKEDVVEADIYDDGSDVQVGVLRIRLISRTEMASSFRRVLEQDWSEERVATRDPSAASTPRRLELEAAAGQVPSVGHPLEVLLLVLEAMQPVASLRLITIQVLARSAVEIAATLPDLPEVRMPVDTLARKALQAAARLVQSHLHGSFADAFLDIFDEEWSPQAAPLSDIPLVCSHPRCLLPHTHAALVPPAVSRTDWSFPKEESERQNAAKAVQALLHAQWLHNSLQQLIREAQALQLEEQPHAELGCPVKVGKDLLDGYQEGKALELGQQACIVCWVVTPAGPCHPRYLVLHQHLLLLVQPDPISPGLALVKTLCPLQSVEATIEGEQRMLSVLMRLARGVPAPGEAEPVVDASSSMLTFKVVLSFEDVNRCLFANQHIQKTRREVRCQVREQVETFINGLASFTHCNVPPLQA